MMIVIREVLRPITRSGEARFLGFRAIGKGVIARGVCAWDSSLHSLRNEACANTEMGN